MTSYTFAGPTEKSPPGRLGHVGPGIGRAGRALNPKGGRESQGMLGRDWEGSGKCVRDKKARKVWVRWTGAVWHGPHRWEEVGGEQS